MTINITSTTDSPEAVTAALGDLAQTAKPAEGKTEAPTTEGVELKPEGEVLAEEAGEAEGSETAEGVELSETDENEIEELEATGEEEPTVEKPKKKGGFQKKLERQKRENAQLAQEKEYWRQEALRAQQSKGTAEQAAPQSLAKSADSSDEPDPNNYETNQAYLKAYAAWAYRVEKKLEDNRQKDESARREFQTKEQAYQERVNEFVKEHDDFSEVLSDVKIQIPAGVRQAIIESEVGPAIAYELAKNQKELQRICSMSVILAAKEIGKLEVRLAKPSSASEKKTVSTLKPVTPVRTKGASTAKSLDDPNLSQKEFERIRAEQIKARRASM